MAYRPLATTTLLIFVFCFASFSTTSNSSTHSIILPSDSKKVSLGLYYESLCPYSANFIINYLVKLFETDLISIVDLNLVPWGNAKIRGNDTFDCQMNSFDYDDDCSMGRMNFWHGPYECLLNTVEACAIHVWPELSEHFPFINCVETLVYEHKYPEWESCFDKLGLDPKPISDCYSSGYGKELELQYAAETEALEPPHKYVPWVVVDGEPLYEDYENFISYICKAYKGIAPNACSKLNIMHGEKTNPTHPVCFGTIILALAARIKSAITSWLCQMNTVVSI